MRIYAANSVFIEVTRRCNMCCAHCLRGDAESIDIQEKYIDAFLDNFEKGAYISSLTFTKRRPGKPTISIVGGVNERRAC